jgi:signal transduction histidine kinase
MRIRSRVAIVLAVSLILAGSLTLVMHALAFRGVSAMSWNEYRDGLLEELGVSRETALRHLRENPEIFLEDRGDQAGQETATTVDEASRAVFDEQLGSAIERSRQWTLIGLGILVAGAIGAGWVLAGRILRPVRLITGRARAASELDLSARVALQGPNDEMKELADTFDGMLDRIDGSLSAQKRFSAHAAHELRTPLSITRSEVAMLLADVDDPDLRERLRSIGQATDRAEHLVSQLLLLARADAGAPERIGFAFDELVGNVVGRLLEGPMWRSLRVDVELAHVSVVGDRTLLESLVRNLVDNAGRYNRPGGWVRIVVRPRSGGGAELDVGNSITESAAPAEDWSETGSSIGLSIVTAVLEAHGGSITWRDAGDSVCAHVEVSGGAPFRPAILPRPAARTEAELTGS